MCDEACERKLKEINKVGASIFGLGKQTKEDIMHEIESCSSRRKPVSYEIKN